MFGYDNDTDTNTFFFLSRSVLAGTLINTAECRSKSYGPCARSLARWLARSHPPSFRRSVEQRLLSSSMTSQSRPTALKHGFDIWTWDAGWIKQPTPDTDTSGLWHYQGKHPRCHSAPFYLH